MKKFMLINLSIFMLINTGVAYGMPVTEPLESLEERNMTLSPDTFEETGADISPHEFSFDFSNLSFEELLEMISEELMDILNELGFEFNTLEDFDQLTDLDDEVWEYMEEQDEAIYWEFYYLVQAFTSDESDVEGESDETTDVEEDESSSTDEGAIESAFSIETLGEVEIEVAPANVAAAQAQAITALRISGVTTASQVDFHRGAGSNHARIRRIPVNANVLITGRQGSWYRIVHSGTTGWVARHSIAHTRQVGVVTRNNAPVRNSRSSSGRVLTRPSLGTRVVIMERTGSWAQVRVGNRTGWMRSNELAISNGRRPGRTTRQTGVRVAPTTASRIQRVLPRHANLMVVQSTTSGWTQVRIRHASGTLTGWVQTSHVQNRNQTRRITRNVTLRNRPSTRGSRVRALRRNTRVTVLAESGNWVNVRVGRQTGWIGRNQIARLALPSQPTTCTNRWVQTAPARPGSPAIDERWEMTPLRPAVSVLPGGTIFEPANGVYFTPEEVAAIGEYVRANNQLGTSTFFLGGDWVRVQPYVPATPATPAQGRWECR